MKQAAVLVVRQTVLLLVIPQAAALVVPQAVGFLVRPLLTLSEFACQKWPFLIKPKSPLLTLSETAISDNAFSDNFFLIGTFYQKIDIF